MGSSSCTTPRPWSATSISSGRASRRNRGSRTPPSPATEFSAGGVVLRGDEVIVIVPVKRDANGQRVMGLPKGHPEPGETPEQAAAREVREETGVEADLVEPLGVIEYSYERRGRKIAKRVAFFRFEYRDGDVADHDHEIEQATWMPLAEAVLSLSYEGERAMLRRVLSQEAPDL